MIKIAVPNKGSLSESAVEILTEAGYKGRGHSKTLNLSLIHISEPTRRLRGSRMPSSA